MKTWLKILLGLFAILLILQIPFFNPEKNYTDEKPIAELTKKYKVPMDVQMHLYNACYDCHSNYTEYPWYYNIQPLSWWMDKHIDEAKRELNFSEFANYSPKRAAHKFHEIAEVMEYRAMPLEYYVNMHDKAKLTNAQYEAVINWAKKMEEEVTKKAQISKN